MTAILGGLYAAALWAAATLCSSRSSRMLGSRVVLAWIMIVGVGVGLPIAVASPAPATVAPSTVALGDPIRFVAGVMLVAIAVGVASRRSNAPVRRRPPATSISPPTR